MQFLRVLSLVGVAAIATPQHMSGPEVVAVRSVVDGNTIDVANYGRVRLAGIHAPRLGRRGVDSEPLADEARRRLAGVVGSTGLGPETDWMTATSGMWVQRRLTRPTAPASTGSQPGREMAVR